MCFLGVSATLLALFSLYPALPAWLCESVTGIAYVTSPWYYGLVYVSLHNGLYTNFHSHSLEVDVYG